MTGTFKAQHGDCIVIERDGALYWLAAGDRTNFVGIAESGGDDVHLARIIVPSTSPFLYASVKFSADYTHAIVDWGRSPRLAEAIVGHSTEFEKESKR
jgi:hypothetical protein